MKENDIDYKNIDFRLSNIEKDIKTIALDPYINNDLKNCNDEKSIVKSLYGNIKEVKSFSELMDWIFKSPAGNIAVTTGLSKLFLPLMIHYQAQYPYIKHYLEMHTNIFDQD